MAFTNYKKVSYLPASIDSKRRLSTLNLSWYTSSALFSPSITANFCKSSDDVTELLVPLSEAYLCISYFLTFFFYFVFILVNLLTILVFKKIHRNLLKPRYKSKWRNEIKFFLQTYGFKLQKFLN